jgi:hypothetical protein
LDRRRVRSALVLAAAFACLALTIPASPVAACSGALVTFEKIRTGAQRIVIGTIVETDQIDGAADRVTLRIEAVIRGVSGPQLILEPPTFMGCDGRITEPVGSRLLVATAPRFFSVGPAEEMHPYWRLLEGDVVEPAGVDDPDPDHMRLAGLVADLGGVPVTSPEPAANSDPASAPATSTGIAVAIVAVTFLAAAALFVTVVAAARRRRGES